MADAAALSDRERVGLGRIDARPWLRAARFGWFAFVALIAVIFLAGAPGFRQELMTTCTGSSCLPWQRPTFEGVSPDFYAWWYLGREIVVAVVCAGIGGMLIWRAGSQPMALAGAYSFAALGGLLTTDVALSLARHGVGWRLIIEGGGLLGTIVFGGFFARFPDGAFRPGWLRPVWYAWIALAVVGYVTPRGSSLHYDGTVNFLLLVILMFVMASGQVMRYRRYARPEDRQQIKWVVYGLGLGFAGLAVTTLALPMIGPDVIPNRRMFALVGMTAASSFLLLIPVSVAVALLRYRLWDVDQLVNRTLVYAALSLATVALYAVAIGVVGSLISRGESIAWFVASGLIALAFQPLRVRLHAGVNRLMYGDRDEPYEAVSRLGRRLGDALSPDAVVPAIVDTVAQALRSPYVAISLAGNEGRTIAASTGEISTDAGHWPLVFQGEDVGELIVAPRSRGESFSRADRRLLDGLANQAGVAVHNLRLSADLQRSRERLVTTREEERRRLRRDLHDGLGPQLASQTLTLDAARKLMSADPETADRLLDDLRGHIETAVADVRRLVYALRPPALDDLGLVGAVQEGLGSYRHGGLVLEIAASDPLPRLPAAVEVAAYRIVHEAVTNVVRHASASRCTVRFSINREQGELEVEVVDDGHGVPALRPSGVGLAAMRERAEELGGVCTIETRAGGGTRVTAALPLREVA